MTSLNLLFFLEIMAIVILNLVTVTLIILRVLYFHRYIRKTVEPQHRSPYIIILIICIESSTFIVVFSLIYLGILFFLQNNASYVPWQRCIFLCHTVSHLSDSRLQDWIANELMTLRNDIIPLNSRKCDYQDVNHIHRLITLIITAGRIGWIQDPLTFDGDYSKYRAETRFKISCTALFSYFIFLFRC